MSPFFRSRAPFFCALLVGGFCSFAISAPNSPEPSPAIKIKADGNVLGFTPGQPCRVPSSTKTISFDIGNPIPQSPNGNYVRYRLDGYDSGWNQQIGEMRLGLRFYDDKNTLIGQTAFIAKGKSSGWTKNLETSTLTHRRELVTIPDGSKSMQVFISSAGPPSCIGVYAVSDILLSKLAKDGSAGATVLETASFLVGGKAPTLDEEWIQDGNQPGMAELLQVGSPGFKNRAFGLIDYDPSSHAEWHQRGKLPLKLNPEDQLVLQWNEMFNTGDANSFTVSYKDLPPGRYRFEANALDTFGNPTAGKTEINLIVPLPFWKNRWVWSVVFIAAVIAAFFLIRTLIRVRVQRQLKRLEQERLVEQERLRIARDIHDDLGARLTQLSLISGMAETGALTEEDRTKFKEIYSIARELVSAMYETVWTVNPQNDHLESLISFLCQSTENLCKPAGIRCRIKASPIPEDKELRSEVRHHVILAVKESVHNAIKHSQATEIVLQISLDPSHLDIVLSDNGCGFNTEQHKSGSGLKNFERRMEAIGGRVALESTGDQGTRIHFQIPLPPS